MQTIRTGAGRSEREIRAMTPRERLSYAQTLELPYSEVNMHMRVAGATRPVIACGAFMAWILNTDGTTFSMPVTRGEAGLR